MYTTSPVFNFLSAYRGEHHYQVQLCNGAKHRLSIRVTPELYDPNVYHQDQTAFERLVNGPVGLITCSADILTEELVAQFNKQAYLDHESQLAKMFANPKAYGEVERAPFPVYVSGRIDPGNGEWAAVQEFDAIRALAGIPPEHCIDPRACLNG
ncbi:MAG: hypothetical protein ACNJA3_27790 (plasmid) [Pseudomonas rhizophila]|uniref:hypothetical protein n=1 Tax=Pseudomonas rhizophila TaxID=2045200 RepID=UPI003F6CB2E3